MRIATVTLTRNDADLLETFVRYHARFVDHMVIMTHRCMDNTQEILDKLVAEGLPIEVVDYVASDGETSNCRIFESGRTVHRIEALFSRTLVDVAQRLDPDWILPIDVDEFLTAGKRSVRDVFAEMSPDEVNLVGWRNYIPMPTDDASEPNALRRIVHHRVTTEDPKFSKAFVPRRVALRPGVGFSGGNHRVIDIESGEVFPGVPNQLLQLAHYPVRSEAQLRVKILAGHFAVISNPVRGFDGFHWRSLYPRCRDLRAISREELRDIALEYAWIEEDVPVPPPVVAPLEFEPFPLRYEVCAADLWEVVLDCAERLAEGVQTLGWARVQLQEQLAGQWRTTGKGPFG